MDLIFSYSLVLILTSAIFFLEQETVSFLPQKAETLSPKNEPAFYWILIKLAMYFGTALSVFGTQGFFESQVFEKLSRRVQVLSFCLWNLSFVFVPVVFLTFFLLSTIYLFVALIVLWFLLLVLTQFSGSKTISVKSGIFSVALPLVLSDQILRGLSSQFASESDPSWWMLALSQRGTDVVFGFFIGSALFSFLLHWCLRSYLRCTWIVPLICLFFVSAYMMSLPVAVSLIAADRMVISYMMYRKMNAYKSHLTQKNLRFYLAVSWIPAFLFWIICIVVSGLFSSEPSAPLRAFQFSSTLLGLELVIFFSTMVWGHFAGRPLKLDESK